jgi:hypothetical protein
VRQQKLCDRKAIDNYVRPLSGPTLGWHLQVRLEVEHTAKEKAIFSYLPRLSVAPYRGQDDLRKFYD